MTILWAYSVLLIAHAASQFQKKWFLNTSHIAMSEFLSTGSVVIAVILIPTIPMWQIDLDKALTPTSLLLLLSVVAGSVLFSWLYYQAMRREKLGRFELLWVISPLVTFALASLFFPEERDPRIWLLGGIAVLGMAYIHWHGGRRITFDRQERTIFFLMVLGALNAIIVKAIINSGAYDSIGFYGIRGLLMGVVMPLIFGWHLRSLTTKRFRGILLGAVLTSLAVPLSYYAYATFGVSLTSLVLSIGGPAVLFIASSVVLRERYSPRIMITGFGVACVVSYALILMA